MWSVAGVACHGCGTFLCHLRTHKTLVTIKKVKSQQIFWYGIADILQRYVCITLCIIEITYCPFRVPFFKVHWRERGSVENSRYRGHATKRSAQWDLIRIQLRSATGPSALSPLSYGRAPLVLFFAPTHKQFTSQIATLDQPSSSSDLAFCDIWLFPSVAGLNHSPRKDFRGRIV